MMICSFLREIVGRDAADRPIRAPFGVKLSPRHVFESSVGLGLTERAQMALLCNRA
jgi:hypothetical protein